MRAAAAAASDKMRTYGDLGQTSGAGEWGISPSHDRWDDFEDFDDCTAGAYTRPLCGAT